MWSAQETDIGSVYRVIAPDLRGHGKSAAPEGVYTVEELAGDVIDTLDSLAIREPVVVGGLSMGGYVALALMAARPERVRALMLMDTRAAADTPEAAGNREGLARRVETEGNTSAVVNAMLPRLFSPYTRQNRAAVIEPIAAAMERTPIRAVTGSLRGMAQRPDRTADLARIHVPTLVLVGADDVITPPDEARAMAQAIPNARLAVIPNAGHLAPLENPTATNAAILDFLRALG
jgi:3-oxoadipate enol-lactonase